MSTDYDPGRGVKTLWAPELALPTLFLLALPILIVVSGGGIESLRSLGLPVAIFYALLLALAVKVMLCRVRLTKDEIVQHSLFGARRVPARDVTAVKLRQLAMLAPPPYPTLHLKDGSTVGLAFAGGYLIGGWKNAAAIRRFYYHLATTGPQATQASRATRGQRRTRAGR